MKTFWVTVLLTFLAVVVYQNDAVFMDQKALKLNLMIWKGETRQVYLFVYFMAFFLAGLLFSYLYGLRARFRASRRIKEQVATISRLKDELCTIKGAAVQDSGRGRETVGPDESE